MTVPLRDVRDTDLEVFFEHRQDQDAVHMAAFTAKDQTDRAAFDAHWAKIRANASILIRTIEANGQVAGHIASFDMADDREITYWIGREFWGQGVATAALTAFLNIETTRPLHGRAAKDNTGSIRVMQKCGFTLIGEDRGFANARSAEIPLVILKLD